MPRYFHYNSVNRNIIVCECTGNWYPVLSLFHTEKNLISSICNLGENTSFENCSELSKAYNFTIENNCFDTYEDSSYLGDLSFYVEVII